MKQFPLFCLALGAGILLSLSSYGQSTTITTFAGNGVSGYSGDGGPATNANIRNTYTLGSDGVGNVYIADTHNNVVRKITNTGVISTIAGNGTTGFSGDGGQATAAQLNGPYGIVVDASNNVYIADNSNNRIRKVDPSGIITTFAGGSLGSPIDAGQATDAVLASPSSLAVDASGNIYVTEFLTAKVRKITPGGVFSTIAGNGTFSYTGDGGPATDATVGQIRGIGVDASNNVYFYDNTYSVVRKISAGGIISTVAGGGVDNVADSVDALTASITGLYSMAVDPSGNIYLPDGIDAVVRMVNTDGIIKTIAGTHSSHFYAGDGGPATDASIIYPQCVAADAVGNIYVGDYGNERVRKVALDFTGSNTICQTSVTTMSYPVSGGTWSSSNPAVATVNSSTGEITGLTNGTVIISYTIGGFSATVLATVMPLPNSGTISGPSVVPIGGSIALSSTQPGGVWSGCNNSVATIDGGGNVSGLSNGSALMSYTVTNGCGSSHATFPVTVGSCVAATNISTIAGNHVAGYSGDGGPASEAELTAPHAIVADASGNVFIADRFNHVIRKINPSGTISTIAGTGVAGFSGDGGPASNAALNNPAGLAFDGDGNLYIADMYNERIRKIDLSGNISTVAGNGYHGGWMGAPFGNGGPATDAALVYPIALAVSCSGEMYIAEYGSQRVRKVDEAGIITNFAGTARAGYNGDGLPATDAELNHPHGVALDVDGNVYIADAWNNRVRIVEATTGKMYTYAGNGAATYAGDGMPKGSASLWIPWGITFDGCGNLYICDYNNNAVRVVDKSTGYITTFAGNGQRGWGYTGDGGPATDASIYLPSGLAIDGSGNIYVADYGNNLIRLIGSTGYAARAYAGGTTQTIHTCEGKTTSIDDMMAISNETGSATWTIGNKPLHGTIEGLNGATAQKGGMITTKGLTYVPEAGFSGVDEFTILVNDGTSKAATTITAIVNALPNVGAIVSDNVITDSKVALSNPTADEGGQWSSSNTQIATVDENGVVAAHMNGVVTISYTLTNECGAKSATSTIVSEVNVPGPSQLSVFPNPTTGTFSCEFSSDVDAQLELVTTDMTGRVLFTQPVTATPGLNKVNVTLPDGVNSGLFMVSLGNGSVNYQSVKITVGK